MYASFQVISIYIIFIIGFSIVLEFICTGEKPIEKYIDIQNDMLDEILEKAKQQVKDSFLKDLNGSNFNEKYAEARLINQVNSYVNPGDRIGHFLIEDKPYKPVNNVFSYNPYDNHFYLKKS